MTVPQTRQWEDFQSIFDSVHICQKSMLVACHKWLLLLTNLI